MYAVGESLPVDELEPGAYLISGPAMSGKYQLLLELIAGGFDGDDAALLVTTNEDAASVLEDLEALGPAGRLRLVDAISERRGDGEAGGLEGVEYVSSPGDLTGLGIAVTEGLREISGEAGGGTRVGFHTLSTLLMYSELETVFRFVHVLTGRVDSVEGLGVFAVDPTTHDDDTLNTIRQLFDGAIELREEDGRREVRLRGIETAPEGWTPRT